MRLTACLLLLVVNHAVGATGGPPSDSPSGADLVDHPAARIAAYNDLSAGRWNAAWKAFAAIPDSPALPDTANPPRPGRLCASLAYADHFARAGKYPEAIVILDRLIAAGTASPLPFDLKAMIQLRTDDLAGAERTLSNAPAHDPGRVHTVLLRAYLQFRKGDTRRAAEILDAAKPAIDDCFLAWNLRGCIAVAAGDFPTALNHFEETARRNPDFPVALANFEYVIRLRGARTFARRGDSPEADAKGYFGVKADISGEIAYSKEKGLTLAASLNTHVETPKIPTRFGLYGSSTDNLADARRLERALPGITGDSRLLASAIAANPISPESDCVSCPLLIWK